MRRSNNGEYDSPDSPHSLYFINYLCFCFFTGDAFFVGATPERQLTVDHGTGLVQMNPISGTFRKSPEAEVQLVFTRSLKGNLFISFVMLTG